MTAGLVSPGTLKLDNAGQSAIAKIVGSGPFVFESEKADEEVVFAKRADYAWAPETCDNQGAAYLDKLVVKYLPEVAHRAGAVQTGQVDLVRGLQPVDEDNRSPAADQVLPAQGVDLTTNMAAVRIASGKLADAKVRQALQVGIDRQSIKDTVLSDSYVIAGSILNHAAPGFVDLSADLAYNPEKSKTLLDEAGWKVGADGIREKDGQKLEVTVTSSNNSVVIKPAFELIEQQWREIGVKLINRAADNTFLATAMIDPNIEFFGTRQFAYGGLGPVFGPATNTQTLNADTGAQCAVRQGTRGHHRGSAQETRRRGTAPAGHRQRHCPWCSGTKCRSTAATPTRTSNSPQAPHPSSRVPGRPASRPSWAAYIARRLGQALLVIWLAYTLVFLAVQLLPNDPVTIFLSADAAATRKPLPP